MSSPGIYIIQIMRIWQLPSFVGYSAGGVLAFCEYRQRSEQAHHQATRATPTSPASRGIFSSRKRWRCADDGTPYGQSEHGGKAPAVPVGWQNRRRLGSPVAHYRRFIHSSVSPINDPKLERVQRRAPAKNAGTCLAFADDESTLTRYRVVRFARAN